METTGLWALTPTPGNIPFHRLQILEEWLWKSVLYCHLHLTIITHLSGLPRWLNGNKSTCQCKRHRRHGCDHWVVKIPWRREWWFTLIYCLGNAGTKEPGGLQSSAWDRRVRHNWTHTHMHERTFESGPGSWWWTGRPGVLWFMGSQRVGHDWATELDWTGLTPE